MSDNSIKIQKISSAIYFVTSFFDEKEPLKWRLRTLALDLSSERIKDKSNIATELTQLFSIARDSGLLSEQNHGIIIGEISKLEKSSEKSLYQLLLEETKTEEKPIL